MNNKPVAWMMVDRENTSAYLTFETPTRDMKVSHEPTPLYTHPAELTDEEILEVWNVLEDTHSAEHDAKVFARAILRKAQEK